MTKNNMLDTVGRSFGRAVVVEPPPPPTDRPLRVPAGIAARSVAHAQGSARSKVATVIVSDWTQRQLHTGVGTLSVTGMRELIDALNWCAANKGPDGRMLDAVFRCDAGTSTPDHIKAAAGTFKTYARDGSNAAETDVDPDNPAFKYVGMCSRYWMPQHWAGWEDFIKLMTRPWSNSTPHLGGIAGHPALAGWSLTLPMTWYAEPCIHMYASKLQRDLALAAGWTVEKNKAAFAEEFRIAQQYIAPLGLVIEATWSKFEIAMAGTPSRYKTDAPTSIALMESQRAKLGGLTMWSNHGWRAGEMDEVYKRMFDGIRETEPVAVSLQTEILRKLQDKYASGDKTATSRAAIQEAMSRGVAWVEITRGVDALPDSDPQAIPLDFVKSLMPSFRANAAATVAPTVIARPMRGPVEDGAYVDGSATGDPFSNLRMPPTWAINAGMRSVRLNVGIRELIDTTSGGVVTYRPDSLEERLQKVADWNAANPSKKLTAYVRFQGGKTAPDMWRTICGQVAMGNAEFGSTGNAPIWWEQPFRDLTEGFWRALGPVIDRLDHVGGCNNPMHSPFYPEPFLLYPDDNGPTLLAAGWTRAKHEAWFRFGVTAPAPVTRKIVYLTINPARWPKAGGGTEQVGEFLWEMVDAHLAARPVGLAGIENDSYAVGRSQQPGEYRDMYARMLGYKSRAWLNVQLARPHKVTLPDPVTKLVWPALADQWLTGGGHSFETTGTSGDATEVNRWPQGWEDYASTLTTLADRAAAAAGPA